ncbi:MsnO8 family LLM class oxidoreductase [Sinorhizobium americanum]|uniref:Bacterial luciferase family protein YtmO, in cluster with L-cystine ABC transporter n=1 Tax=Sinorhizobium americanum TaxID=194963 RepID=A0A1L3LYC1_9HYPH|nr:MsnO8 family LLM class oxidoreductase [Sinorhizobium americanum]APG95115.1 bacterial luciferase family protein YtmO, in cluster with L-cystine ABC transporter [Sinorhizobium americanum]OAP43170.1 alkane 1-monooxygenase [Sinorhizobium americanum]
MAYQLSLLDKSPLDEGKTAADALQATAALAARAEELGYCRFWVAEHHNMAGLASSAPETLIAYLLARTSRIRVGSGGVMLQHYSTYKVAETFNLLATLAPGRVDLGVGKAPGGLPLATRALQAAVDPSRRQSFAEQLADLNRYLDPDEGRDGGLFATPLPPTAPDRFLLGAGVESARLAAEKGWKLVFAGHLNGDPDNLEKTFKAYEQASGGDRPILALAALAAETEGGARERVAGVKIFKVFLADGQSVNVGSEEQAAEFARQAGVAEYRIEEKTPSVVHGTAQQVHDELDALHQRHGVTEFIIDTPAVGAAERLTSIELIARARLSLAA